MDPSTAFPVGQTSARLVLGLALLAAGCAVGPDYRRPAAPPAPAFKENPGWKTATPEDGLKRGPWWEVFQDPVLTELEIQVETSNLTLAQAVANFEEARQIARADRTGFLPTVDATGSAVRSHSPTGEIAPTTIGGIVGGRSLTQTLYSAELQGTWVPDFWGKLSRQVESDVATAQSDAALVASARLSTQGSLATDYIQLRVADDQIRLLENAVEAYKRTLTITKNKYAVGVSARSDIITAQTQLDSTRAALIGAGVQRAQLEHAIAVLLGKAPSEFSVARRPDLGISIPELPPMLPSTLLERRPDVSAAERDAAAANARIGVQVAAYFPDLTLSGTGGFEGSPLRDLFTTPFRFWTLGGQVSDALLDWGQRHDEVLSAKAAYTASAANYKQTVLTAFQQVEDNLASLRILRAESQVEQDAVNEAAQAAQIALNEYNAGTADFTTVATAEVTELTNRETALGIRSSELTSSVALIQALGGGWSTADLPSPHAIVAHRSPSP